MKLNKKITVLGEGQFGTAIATILAHNGYEVTLWCNSKQIAHTINTANINSKYFPDLILSNKIIATDNLHIAIEGADYIFEAIPVKFLRSVIENLKNYIKKHQVLVLLSKGIEQDTLLLPEQIIKNILPNIEIAVMAGPSFASELVNQKLTAVNLACPNIQTSYELKSLLQNDYFKIKIIHDLIGLQICAALKNIITIAMGIAQGANLADNTIAYLFTIGLAETALLVEKLNGNQKTVYDFAGVGDLVLCAYGKYSRNFWFGQEIGQGKKIDEILQRNKDITIEGLNTLQSIKALSIKLNINLPLCNAIYGIIFENQDIKSIIKDVNE